MSESNKETTIKVDNEVKEQVNTLVSELEVGSQKEALRYLLNLHVIKKESDSGKAIPRLGDMRYHFNRIESIFTEYVLTSRDQEVLDAETIEHLKVTADTLKGQLFDRSNEIDDLKKLIETIRIEMQNDLNKQIEQYSSEIDRVKGESALFRENAAKEVEQMRELVEQYKEAKSQSEALVRAAQEVSDNSLNKLKEAQEKVSSFDSMKKELESLKGDNLRLVAEIKEKEFEAKTVALESEKRFVEQINKLRDDLVTSREINAELRIELSLLKNK